MNNKKGPLAGGPFFFDRQDRMKTYQSLLVRGVNWLGDAVMSLPALYALKEYCPKAHITVYTPEKLAFLYQHVPCVSKVISFQKKNGFEAVRERLKSVNALKYEKFDGAIIFPNSFDSALMPFLAKIPVRAGFSLNGRSLMLTNPLDPPKNFFQEHHSRHYLRIVKEFLGIEEVIAPARYFPLLRFEASVRQKTLEELNCLIPDYQRPLIALCPGAEYGPAKKWPKEYYTQIARRVSEELKGSALVLGTPKEAQEGLEMIKGLEHSFSLAGKTDLPQFIRILSCCDFIVTNDSGAMHLAGALNIPGTAAFGSTEPSATRAMGPIEVFYDREPCSPCFERICPLGHTKCLTKITPEAVWKKLSEVLKSAGFPE